MQKFEQFHFTDFPTEKINDCLKYIVLSRYKSTNSVDERLLSLVSPTEQANVNFLIEQDGNYQELKGILSKAIKLQSVMHPSRARANLINHLKDLQDGPLLNELLSHQIKDAVECYDKLSLDYNEIKLGFSTGILNHEYLWIEAKPCSNMLSEFLQYLNLPLSFNKEKQLECLSMHKIAAYFSALDFDEDIINSHIRLNSEFPLAVLNDCILLNFKYPLPQIYINHLLAIVSREHTIQIPLDKLLLSYSHVEDKIADLQDLLSNSKVKLNTFDFVNDVLNELLWNHIKTQILDGIHFSPIPSDLIEALCRLIDKCIEVAPQNMDVEELSDTRSILNISLLDIPTRNWKISSKRLKSLVKNIFQPSQHRQRVLEQL